MASPVAASAVDAANFLRQQEDVGVPYAWYRHVSTPRPQFVSDLQSVASDLPGDSHAALPCGCDLLFDFVYVHLLVVLE